MFRLNALLHTGRLDIHVELGKVPLTKQRSRTTSTNVGRYQGRTLQTSDLQTLDWYKRRTSTNVEPVQTSDEYIYKEKRRTLVEFNKKDYLYKK